jgi:hypothetical protein
LSAQEQADRKNVDKLVETTERILESEQRGWMQQMQDALAQLRGERAASESGQEPNVTKNSVFLLPAGPRPASDAAEPPGHGPGLSKT